MNDVAIRTDLNAVVRVAGDHIALAGCGSTNGVGVRREFNSLIRVGDRRRAGRIRADKVTLHDVAGSAANAHTINVTGDDIAICDRRTADRIVVRIDSNAFGTIPERCRAGHVSTNIVSDNRVVIGIELNTLVAKAINHKTANRATATSYDQSIGCPTG